MVLESSSSPDPSISLVEPGLYLGDLESSYSTDTLESNKITALVSLADHPAPEWSAAEHQALVPPDRHLFVHCHDSPTQDILAKLSEICNFIDRMHDGGQGHVLVHCARGVSRSPTVVVAYLMRKYRQPLDLALTAVQRVRRVRPNSNFLAQLYVWDEVHYECWDDANKSAPKEPYQAYVKKRAEIAQAQGPST